MKKSILRKMFIAYMSFGILMGSVFPFYADFFVEWKDGMFVWFTVGCLLAGVTMGMATFHIMKHLLIKPLEKIASVATAISNKDLTERCDIESDDVIGEIIQSFDCMANNLDEILAELSEHCTEIEGSVSKVASVAADSAQSSDMQFNEVQKIQQSINELQSSISLVAENTSQAMKISNETTSDVEQGNKIVNQSVSVINNLASSIENATQTIDSLKSETESIGSVLASIQGISEQTNLLALNAAIEAARAGEQGRGFAVVADEVRNLAQRTQESTLEIQNMIDRLQKGATTAVELMECSTSDAHDSVEVISRAEARLNHITDNMLVMSDKNLEIKTAAEQQISSVEAIHDNITNVGLLTTNSQEGSKGSANESEKLKILTTKLSKLFAGFKTHELPHDIKPKASVKTKSKTKNKTTSNATVQKQEPSSDIKDNSDDDVMFF